MKTKKLIYSLFATISCGLRNIWAIVRTFASWVAKNAFAIELVATTLGVLAAFYLANLQQQQHLNSITAQRLHLVVLESRYNSSAIKKAFEEFSKGTSNTIMIKQIDTPLAIAAINDPNIVSFLPTYKLVLLASYIDSQKKLDHALTLHNDYLLGLLGSEESSKNQEAISKTLEAFSENIRENAATAASTCYYLQNELEAYFDKETYDHERVQSQKLEIEKTKKGILSGELQITTEK